MSAGKLATEMTDDEWKAARKARAWRPAEAAPAPLTGDALAERRAEVLAATSADYATLRRARAWRDGGFA